METLLYSPLSEQLTAAMRYSVAGGKGLRGFLVMESSRLHGVSEGRSLRAALGVECLHAYSLVHDDLPCMDDDDLRRGQPTVHVKWDQATAVLAGDALQADAFKFVSETGGSVQVLRRLIATFSFAAGARGMVGGQAADIAAEMSGGRLTLDEITSLQNAKTGALLTWSCIAGPILAEADEKSMKTYGDALGLAFQIADDILDVEGDAAEVGKATQKDEAAGKATFVSLLGLDEAKRRAQALVDEACEALSPYGNDAQTLREAAQFVVSRSK
nr:farnesyl diphosphate synthase [Cognatiyoonia sediminum]